MQHCTVSSHIKHHSNTIDKTGYTFLKIKDMLTKFWYYTINNTSFS